MQGENRKKRSKEERWKKRQGQSTKAAVSASNHGRVLLNSNIVMKTFVQILNGQQSYIVCHNPPAIHPTCSRAFPFSRLIWVSSLHPTPAKFEPPLSAAASVPLHQHLHRRQWTSRLRNRQTPVRIAVSALPNPGSMQRAPLD